MRPNFSFLIAFVVALAWNLPGLAVVAWITLGGFRWGFGDRGVAFVAAAVGVIIGSAIIAAGVVYAGARFARSTGSAPREVTREAATISAAYWPIGLIGLPLIAFMVLTELMGPGWGPGLLAVAPGLLIGAMATPVRTLARLYRLKSARVVAEVREAYPADGVCPDCGLAIARQSPRLPLTHPLAWLIPGACVVAVSVGIAVLVVLTAPGTARPGAMVIWWSWRGFALLAFPLYVLLIGSWLVPRWLCGRPVRFVRSRRLARGLCVLCEHGLLETAQAGSVSRRAARR